jgi:hypothetical protein
MSFFDVRNVSLDPVETGVCLRAQDSQLLKHEVSGFGRCLGHHLAPCKRTASRWRQIESNTAHRAALVGWALAEPRNRRRARGLAFT